MTAPVYGEIEDGNHILIRVGGTDWDAQDAAPLLQTMTAKCSEVKDENGRPYPDRLTVPLTYPNVTQLSNLFKGSRFGPDLHWTPGPELSAWIIAEVMRRSCQGDFAGEKPLLDPMPHQYAGAVAIGMNGRFLLADEMGCGKLGCTLMGLAELDVRNRNPWPCAAVVPASIVDTWLEEIEKWYPQWSAVAYRGPNRGKWLRSDARLLVMSYETMRNDTGDTKSPGPLLRKKFGTIVYDEAHKLANSTSRQSERGRRLARYAANVICTTGTPITKSVSTFWPALNCLDHESYPSRDRFKSRYCLARNDGGYGEAEVTGLNPAMEPEFRLVTQGTWRRVAVKDVVSDLPERSYETRWLTIPDPFRASYDQMAEDLLAHLPENDTPLSAQNTLVQMLRLSQLAHSACDVEVWHELETNEKSPSYGEMVERTKVTPRRPSWKGTALLEILSELHQSDGDPGTANYVRGSRPVVAFAPFKGLIDVVGKMCEEKKWATGYITGGMTDKARTAIRHSFQNHELDILLVTVSAGGVGLTLHSSHDAVYLARPWGYVESSQSEARIYRKGQRCHTHIIDLVARNSIEAKVRAALHGKAAALSSLLRDRRIVESFLKSD